MAALWCCNANKRSACVTRVVQDVHTYTRACVCLNVLLRSGMPDTLTPHSSLAPRRAARACCVSPSCYARSAVIRASTPLACFTAICSFDLPFRSLSAIHTAPLSSVMKSSTVDSETDSAGGGGRCSRVQVCSCADAVDVKRTGNTLNFS